MNVNNKMKMRAKIIDSIRALPTDRARQKWAQKLGAILFEINKNAEKI